MQPSRDPVDFALPLGQEAQCWGGTCGFPRNIRVFVLEAAIEMWPEAINQLQAYITSQEKPRFVAIKCNYSEEARGYCGRNACIYQIFRDWRVSMPLFHICGDARRGYFENNGHRICCPITYDNYRRFRQSSLRRQLELELRNNYYNLENLSIEQIQGSFQNIHQDLRGNQFNRHEGGDVHAPYNQEHDCFCGNACGIGQRCRNLRCYCGRADLEDVRHGPEQILQARDPGPSTDDSSRPGPSTDDSSRPGPSTDDSSRPGPSTDDSSRPGPSTDDSSRSKRAKHEPGTAASGSTTSSMKEGAAPGLIKPWLSKERQAGIREDLRGLESLLTKRMFPAIADENLPFDVRGILTHLMNAPYMKVYGQEDENAISEVCFRRKIVVENLCPPDEEGHASYPVHFLNILHLLDTGEPVKECPDSNEVEVWAQMASGIAFALPRAYKCAAIRFSPNAVAFAEVSVSRDTYDVDQDDVAPVELDWEQAADEGSPIMSMAELREFILDAEMTMDDTMEITIKSKSLDLELVFPSSSYFAECSADAFAIIRLTTQNPGRRPFTVNPFVRMFWITLDGETTPRTNRDRIARKNTEIESGKQMAIYDDAKALTIDTKVDVTGTAFLGEDKAELRNSHLWHPANWMKNNYKESIVNVWPDLMSYSSNDVPRSYRGVYDTMKDWICGELQQISENREFLVLERMLDVLNPFIRVERSLLETEDSFVAWNIFLAARKQALKAVYQKMQDGLWNNPNQFQDRYAFLENILAIYESAMEDMFTGQLNLSNDSAGAIRGLTEMASRIIGQSDARRICELYRLSRVRDSTSVARVIDDYLNDLDQDIPKPTGGDLLQLVRIMIHAANILWENANESEDEEEGA